MLKNKHKVNINKLLNFFVDKLKNEDDLKNEGDLKNEDDPKNEDDLKHEDNLKSWPSPPIFFDPFPSP